MKRILIGFMGNTKDTGKYVYEEGLTPTRFPMCAIYEKYLKENKNIDVVICLGTKQSETNRNEVSMNLQQLKYINLPLTIVNEEVIDVTNQEELHYIFKKIDKLLEKYILNSKQVELIVDITNGYRTQPLLGVLVSNFITKKYSQVNVENIWYGLMKVDDKENSKLLSVKKYNELIDWANGFQNFLETGETSILMHLVYSSNDIYAKSLVEKLDRFSRMLKVGRNEEAKEYVREVLDSITTFKKNQHNKDAVILESMLNKIEEKFKSFEDGFYYAITEWNFHHGNIQQSLTICTEYFPYIAYQNNMILNLNKNTDSQSYDNQDILGYAKYCEMIKKEDYSCNIFMIENNHLYLKSVLDLIINEVNNILQSFNKGKLEDYIEHIHQFAFSLDKEQLWNKTKNQLLNKFSHYDIEIKFKNQNIIRKPIHEKILDFILYVIILKNVIKSDCIENLINNLTNEYKTSLNNENYHGKITISDIIKGKPKYLEWLKTYKSDEYNFLKNYVGVLWRFTKKELDKLKIEFIDPNEEIDYDFMFIDHTNVDMCLKDELSQYFLLNTNNVQDILRTYNLIREYRNDINHGGFSLTHLMNHRSPKTKTLNDYEKDILKNSIDKLIQYMKKLESNEY